MPTYHLTYGGVDGMPEGEEARAQVMQACGDLLRRAGDREGAADALARAAELATNAAEREAERRCRLP